LEAIVAEQQREEMVLLRGKVMDYESGLTRHGDPMGRLILKTDVKEVLVFCFARKGTWPDRMTWTGEEVVISAVRHYTLDVSYLHYDEVVAFIESVNAQ
jgi:hypothetical protein